MADPRDNRELTDAAREGDRAAFDELVERFDRRVRAHVERRLGAALRRRVTVDDVLAETWARAWRGLRAFEWAGEAALVRWLQTVAERVILAVAGARRADEVIYLETLPDGAGSQVSASRAARRGERFDRLETVLAELEPDQREAVLLVRIHGLKLREAGERMGRSQNAVMHLLRRGLRKLRSRLTETDSLTLPSRRILEDVTTRQPSSGGESSRNGDPDLQPPAQGGSDG